MKKLLYLVPFILIGLSILPVSLYKDKVDFLLAKNPNAKVEDISGALTELSPSHWKMIDFQTNISADLDSASLEEAANQTQPVEPEKPKPLYEEADFKGFPFAAYFSINSGTDTANSQSSVSASGFSWLWAAIDGLLILASLIISFKVNRKKKTPQVVGQAPSSTIPSSEVSTSNQPRPTVVQPNVITPTQPQQPQAPQSTQQQTATQPAEANENRQAQQ